MERIAKDPYASSLRTHRLKGPLAGCFASRLSREYRVIFMFNADRVLFIDIGAMTICTDNQDRPHPLSDFCP
jgi:Txe/YoeB family toxin of Txe-Axe toxin-antitoxin module